MLCASASLPLRPRIYLSSNSGARIGLVDDLKSKFKVAWQDVSNPGLGFKYLYLSKDDFNALKPGTVNAQLIKEEGEERYAISDIIGQVRPPPRRLRCHHTESACD
jgi:acetyl-CoA carboxylase/biotin carboxylase 1